ncbi:two-component regulator propeller domain-containing protein [Algoriphagus jejuensis]|uniref:Two-component regulator propeller domain-containing protein n=1 Tax=Algoriphagus jejuensis TaxID=419934 RepID=A0ABN1N1Q8_9BACT
MKKVLFAFLLVFQVTIASAETKRFFVTRFGTAEGLATNQVLAIHKDSHKYLWVGSANGLQRFDGRAFMSYEIRTPGEQPSKPVSEILTDTRGKMWLRVGEDYGSYVPENQLFTKFFFEKKEDRALGESLWMDSKGNLFVILNNNKLLWIDQERGIITDQNLPVKIPPGWRPRAVFEDKSGRYWVSSVEGLSVFDPKTQVIYTREHNPLGLEILKNPDFGYVFNYNEDSHGVAWINYWAPEEKLVSYDPQTKTWKDHKAELSPSNPNYQEAFGHLELPGGELWRYGVQTLADFDPNTKKFTPIVQSDLRFDIVSKMIWDDTGGLWLATDSGLYFLHFDMPSIYFLDADSKAGNNEYQAIEEVIFGGDTSLWLGSWGKGLNIIKLEQGKQDTQWAYRGAPNPTESLQIWDIHHDKKRNLVWVGLQGGLLQIVDLQSKKVRFLYPEAIGKSTIRTIAEDGQGNLWFGTQNGSIIKYEGEGFEDGSFRRIQKFSGRIPQILVSKDQHLWVTTTNEGVYVLDLSDGKILRQLDDSILASNNIQRVLQVNDSIFLFGHELLNKYNSKSGKNEVFSHSDGLASNTILHMESEPNGLAWIYTPNGLSRFDIATNTFYSFGKNHFFSTIPADGRGGTRLSHGELAFISSNAMMVFDPSQFGRNLPPIVPAITNIALFGTYIGDGSVPSTKTEFSAHENSLTIAFNILNFILQDRFTYHYRLVGADPEWREAKKSFEAVYSLLPPGDYSFEVKSANESGQFSDPARYDFIIKPSLAQTWWFKALLALIFLAVVYVIYSLHINRILAVAKLRNQLARDLHDDMGSTLSTINILSSMAKTKIGIDPAKSSEYISKISENSQRMMEAMDDIVWSIKPQNDTMEKLVARMREFANEALESKDILLSMEIGEKVLDMKLSMDARRDLFLIFKEGINNAAKYSKAERIFISFSVEKNTFTLRIRDYGIGFDLDKLDEGNGLENMKKRAKNLNGILTIQSTPNEGTTLNLRIAL